MESRIRVWRSHASTDGCAGARTADMPQHGPRDQSTFHPTKAVVLLVDIDAGALTPMAGHSDPLTLGSTLGRMLMSAGDECHLNFGSAESFVPLLPPEDRRWIGDNGLSLFVPLVSSDGRPMAVVALGSRLAEQPFAAATCSFEAMAGACAVTLENRLLLDPPRPDRARPARPIASIDWEQEPAAQCPRCHTVWASRTETCPCGAATVQCPLPHLLLGKFRVERVVGHGGMGVVYRATDVALDRVVAIKTLPSLTHEAASRLRREARVMASVLHPHLALIYGFDTWRGTPVLIVEHLDGGTLADRLRVGPLPMPRRSGSRWCSPDVRSTLCIAPESPSRHQTEQHRPDPQRRAEAARLRPRERAARAVRWEQLGCVPAWCSGGRRDRARQRGVGAQPIRNRGYAALSVTRGAGRRAARSLVRSLERQHGAVRGGRGIQSGSRRHDRARVSQHPHVPGSGGWSVPAGFPAVAVVASARLAVDCPLRSSADGRASLGTRLQRVRAPI
jgi:hypothetical protein